MAEPYHPSLVWANDFLLDNGRRPIQLAPHGGIVPIRRTSDTYPQSEREQLYKPLISENQRDEDDIKHFYNADLANSFHHQDYAQLEAKIRDDVDSPYAQDDKLSITDKKAYETAVNSAANDVMNN